MQTALNTNSGTSSVIVSSVQNTTSSGVCGNFRCENGENNTTCPHDCVVKATSQVCPSPTTGVGSTQMACGGNGVCSYGACVCNQGYRGPACDYCDTAAGFQAYGSVCIGGVVTNSTPAPTAGTAGTGSGSTGSGTSTGTGTGAKAPSGSTAPAPSGSGSTLPGAGSSSTWPPPSSGTPSTPSAAPGSPPTSPGASGNFGQR